MSAKSLVNMPDVMPKVAILPGESQSIVANDATDASSSDSVNDDILVRDEDSLMSAALFTVCPSHILQDGTFVHLPPPADFERTRFFERSVARHGLIQEDLQATQKRRLEENGKEGSENTPNEKKAKASKDPPQIHPLALASARIQSNGINELNRAINLQSLVSTGEYFGLSNIVDPSFDHVSSKSRDSKPEKKDGSSRPDNSGADGSISASRHNEEDSRARALYILQRKHDIFQQATNTLNRHRRRLVAAVVSQKQIDTRWRELRPFWRLVAPEHGTRALPHAVKTTEIICADVDVYHHSGIELGRLASRVPRFASIDLSSDYTVTQDVKDWKINKIPSTSNSSNEEVVSSLAEPMEVDNTTQNVESHLAKQDTSSRRCTKAYPYAVDDPTIGNVNVDCDSSNVSMLTLQFTIEKPSTGYCESVCLEPIMNAFSEQKETTSNNDSKRNDEHLLILLQHSLFCSKLFESMRRELAADTENLGQVRTTSTQNQQVAWITGHSDECFIPPPSTLIGANHPELVPICVVHVHEGDFKVLLDCEYTLNVKLVESDIRDDELNVKKPSPRNLNDKTSDDSGSQSSCQLRLLCHALLLHAQETYHRHSVHTQRKIYMEQDEREKKHIAFLKANPHSKAVPFVKTEPATSPLTLQNCISLGSKMLFESRIRKVLRKVKDWLQERVDSNGEKLTIEWLALPVFDLAAQFTVSYRSWYIDANIACDCLTITSFGGNGEYRKVKFYSDKLFELFLRSRLKRVISSVKVKVNTDY